MAARAKYVKIRCSFFPLQLLTKNLIGGYGTVHTVSYFNAVLKIMEPRVESLSNDWQCWSEHHSTMAFATGSHGQAGVGTAL